MHALTKAQFGMELTREDLATFLSLKNGDDMEELFALARGARERRFGDKIYLYGFVYFSTYCRNDCAFCYYRRDNGIERYRKEPAEVEALARALVASGVQLVDLTMGEDPVYHAEEFDRVLRIVRSLKADGIPVMLSPGVIPETLIDAFANAGADWFALYQETHNRTLFENLRPGQSYDERMRAKLYAKRRGMLVEEGLLLGVGESVPDIVDSIVDMKRIGASQCRAMSFVPQKGSPMASVATPPRELERKVIAAMRLYLPEALIPASLDVDGIDGLHARLDAGANVVTSIIPPHAGLRGVAQGGGDVEEGGRTVAEVKEILKGMNLRIAAVGEYQKELSRLKSRAEDGE
jgi:methylornithine synthase